MAKTSLSLNKDFMAAAMATYMGWKCRNIKGETIFSLLFEIDRNLRQVNLSFEGKEGHFDYMFVEHVKGKWKFHLIQGRGESMEQDYIGLLVTRGWGGRNQPISLSIEEVMKKFVPPGTPRPEIPHYWGGIDLGL